MAVAAEAAYLVGRNLPDYIVRYPGRLVKKSGLPGLFLSKTFSDFGLKAVREFDILNSRSGLNNEKWRETDESGRF